MPFVNCVSCGSPIGDDATFCAKCGTPRPDAAITPADAVSTVHHSEKDFELTASALGLFGRALLMGIGMLLIVPAPWLVCWFYEWLIENIQGRRGSKLTFDGTPGSVWILTTLYGLFFIANVAGGAHFEEDDTSGAALSFQVGIQLASFALAWAMFRWTAGRLQLDGRRLKLTAGFLGYLGWNVLVYISIITIIGWAWVSVLFYNWLANKTVGAPGRFTFVAKGHQILWRTLAYILFMVPIVTIPWAIRWYFAWLVEQFRFEETAPQAASGLYKTQEL